MPPLNQSAWEPHGFTIFCDDIREEVGGKTTYVGAYTNVMFVGGELPMTLPKLGLSTFLFFQPGDSFENLELRITLPGEKVEASQIHFEISPPPADVDSDLPDYGDVLEFPRKLMGFKSILSPFTIKQFGRLRISAMWDKRLVPLGSLLITPASPPPQT